MSDNGSLGRQHGVNETFFPSIAGGFEAPCWAKTLIDHTFEDRERNNTRPVVVVPRLWMLGKYDEKIARRRQRV